MEHHRKHPRLNSYDYSKQGYYFVTICTQNSEEILSKISPVCDKVGRGLAPALFRTDLTIFGEIAEEQLFALQERYPYVKIDKYVIMPNHIHVIIILGQKRAGASPRPTLCDIICSYKSITTLKCNKRDNIKGRKIFQTSFYEHIIRNEKAYTAICRYIYENPIGWYHGHNKEELQWLTKCY